MEQLVFCKHLKIMLLGHLIFSLCLISSAYCFSRHLPVLICELWF
uniref:Uncharacterized protein n=1 Tax=Rhizophora mucronata TaxID=61149 RepID=A0A2P2NN86_RHIMU